MIYLLPLLFAFDLYTAIEPTDTPISEKTLSLLNQSFHYIGEGAQTYAFASKDGTVVLKLFKASHQKRWKLHRLWHKLTTSPAVKQAKWQKKFALTCRRYELAYDIFKEETGLIALHFQATRTPHLITLYDAKNRSTKIDLSKHPFILQKKATLLPDYFKERNSSEIKESLIQIKEFFNARAKKGITDPRQSLNVNYGFVDGHLIQIDVGKIEKVDQVPQSEINQIFQRVDNWYNNWQINYNYN